MAQIVVTIKLEYDTFSPELVQDLSDAVYDFVARESSHGLFDPLDAELKDYDVSVVFDPSE